MKKKPLYFIIHNHDYVDSCADSCADNYDNYDNYKHSYKDEYNLSEFLSLSNSYVISYNHFTDDFNHSDILRVRGLRDLLEGFYSSSRDYFPDILSYMASIEFGEYIIFRYDDNSGIISLAQYNSIIDIIDDMLESELGFDNLVDDNLVDDLLMGDYLTLAMHPSIDKFLDLLEFNVNQSVHFFMTYSYDGMLFRKGSDDYHRYIEHLTSSEERGDFIYEHGVLLTKLHIARMLLEHGVVGVSMSERVGDYHRKFGFRIEYDNCYEGGDSDVCVTQLTASEVMSTYSTGEHGNVINPELNRNFIFCGSSDDDVICGFDLL